ncbi:MAG: helix-turn-helix transcriptional regulator [Phycisphaerales bacterium]|nr:helix-turn-helix transcriptional regulator [Phycisphaerales bacterium]
MNTVSLSADLVAYLRDSRGMSLRQIGELVDLSESYVSRVANGQRRFTLEHLDRFEKALGQPLPLLLLEACWKPKAPSGEQAMFDEALALLRRSASLSAKLETESNQADSAENAA